MFQVVNVEFRWTLRRLNVLGSQWRTCAAVSAAHQHTEVTPWRGEMMSFLQRESTVRLRAKLTGRQEQACARVRVRVRVCVCLCGPLTPLKPDISL